MINLCGLRMRTDFRLTKFPAVIILDPRASRLDYVIYAGGGFVSRVSQSPLPAVCLTLFIYLFIYLFISLVSRESWDDSKGLTSFQLARDQSF